MTDRAGLRLLSGLGLVAAVAIGGPGLADEIVLKSGSRVIGVIEQETAGQLIVDIGIGPRLTFAHTEIETVHRASAEENARLRAAWVEGESGPPVRQPEPAEPDRPPAPERGQPRTPQAPARRPTERIAEGSQPGQRAPTFSAADLTGRTQALSRYRGKVLVLHFWASWCPYCRGEIPKLQTVQQQFSQGVRVLTVSVDEDVGALQRFVASSGLSYPVIVDRRAGTSLARQYGVSGIPVTLVLQPDGRVAFRSDGSTDIVGAVRQVLAQSSGDQLSR